MEPDWENGNVGDLLRWGVSAAKVIIALLLIIAVFSGVKLWM